MPASIRGHQGQFKIFENGELTNVIDLTGVDVNQDSDFIRTEFVGRPQPGRNALARMRVRFWRHPIYCS